MLEVIESDFARLESETSAAEAMAQREHDTVITDSQVDKEAKSTSIEHKTAKKQDQSQALALKMEDLEGTQRSVMPHSHISTSLSRLAAMTASATRTRHLKCVQGKCIVNSVSLKVARRGSYGAPNFITAVR